MESVTKEELKKWVKDAVQESIVELRQVRTKERLTLSEALEFLAECGYVTSKSKIQKLSASGEIPRDIINGKYSFVREELRLWVEQQIEREVSKTNAAMMLYMSAARKNNSPD